MFFLKSTPRRILLLLTIDLISIYFISSIFYNAYEKYKIDLSNIYNKDQARYEILLEEYKEDMERYENRYLIANTFTVLCGELKDCYIDGEYADYFPDDFYYEIEDIYGQSIYDGALIEVDKSSPLHVKLNFYDYEDDIIAWTYGKLDFYIETYQLNKLVSLYHDDYSDASLYNQELGFEEEPSFIFYPTFDKSYTWADDVEDEIKIDLSAEIDGLYFYIDLDSVIDPDSIYKPQKPKTPRFQNVSFHGLLVNGNWFITNIILSMLLIIFNIRKIITIYKDVIEISKAQAPINTNVWRMNNGAENMDDFIKNGIITLIVTLILITGITFMGFMSANSSLEDQYNQKLDEYEDMLSAYNSNLEVYNQKLAVAQEFKETGLMNANVTVNTQHVNDERVGNEISYTTNVNGQGIDYSDTIQLQKDTPISLYAQVVDDEKYPDIGSDSKTVTLLLKN